MADADPFVKRMLARNEARRAKLSRMGSDGTAEQEKENVCNHKTTDSNVVPDKITEDKPVEVEEKITKEVSDERNEATKFSTASKVSQNTDDDYKTSTSASRGRFNALARRNQQMQQWEDDYNYHSNQVKPVSPSKVRANSPLKSVKKDSSPSKPQYVYGESVEIPVTVVKTSRGASTDLDSARKVLTNKVLSADSKEDTSPTNKVFWDSKLINSLEAQGFSPSKSQTKLVYEFTEDKKEESQPMETEENPKVLSCVTKTTTTTTFRETESLTKTRETVTEPDGEPASKTQSRDQSPGKVSNLRSRWEQQIREHSPDRQTCRARSPIKTLPTGHTSHDQIPVNSVPRARSPIKTVPITREVSPSKGDSKLRPESPIKSVRTPFVHQSRSVVKGSANCGDHRSRSPLKTPTTVFKPSSAGGRVVKGVVPMPDTEPVVNDPHQCSVKERARAFAAVMTSAPAQENSVDPADMSMRSRRNIFEKKKGDAILPKVPFAQSIPAKMLHTTDQKVSKLPKVNLESEEEVDEEMNVSEESMESSYPESEISHQFLSPGPPKPPRSFASPRHVSPSSTIPSSPEPDSRSSTLSYKPRVKDGCLYPGLSDFDSQSEADTDINETVMTESSIESFGAKIQRVAESQRAPELNTVDEEEDIDDALNEALTDETPPKRQKVEREPPMVSHNRVGGTPLQHTVSMYRKQRPNQPCLTPVRKVVIGDQAPSTVVTATASPSVAINRQIAALNQKEASELRIITQASVAVSVAEQRADQFGTSHHLEAEKLLLLSTQKRQAILNEMQRLKTEASLNPEDQPQTSKGSIAIKEVSIPLNQEFLMKGISYGSQHFVLLTKYRDQVLSSSIQSTPGAISNACITFPKKINLDNLSPDFTITLEVYAMKIPNPSSHSKKESSKLKLTPLKRLQKSHSTHSPVVSSPGGPGAIRSSSFSLVGVLDFSISNLTSNVFPLERVPPCSPLTGQIHMKLQCSMQEGASEKSFLTVFQDVGGFGAWSRRWAVLEGDSLKFWTYPEQEGKQEANISVSLKQVVTANVQQVSRDVCARPNTILLTMERPTSATDTSSLTCDVTSHSTITKLLLSADSTEERKLWCSKLNVALANVRAWCSEAMRPTQYNV